MDSNNIVQLEKQGQYFFPALPINICESFKKVAESHVSLAFEQLYKEFSSLSEDVTITPEECFNAIKQMEKIYLEAGHSAMEKTLNKIEELILIPECLDVCPTEKVVSPSNLREIQTKYMNTKHRVFEQKAFIKLLKEELIEYAQLQPIIDQAGALLKIQEQLPTLNVPKEAIETMCETMKENSNILQAMVRDI